MAYVTLAGPLTPTTPEPPATPNPATPVEPATDRRRAGTGPTLPPAGPSWFGSVMGTGILATLIGLHAAGHPDLLLPAAALLVVGWGLLVGLTTAFVRRVAGDRDVLWHSATDPAVAPMWGTVSMGVLSVGSATLTVVPRLAPRLVHGAVGVDLVLWTVGTVLGIATTLAFLGAVVSRDLGRPTPVWGLPVVPPMVSATTAAALVPHLPDPALQAALLLVGAVCFVLALAIGGLVFAVAYHHHVRVAPIPTAASASAWIPLGVVGQSMAAACAIAAQSGRFLTPATASEVSALARSYGWVMLVVAVPVVAFAVRVTMRGFRAGMPFSPGWWSLTFPLGTLALGAHLLAAETDSRLVAAVGALALVGLVGTWSLCAVATSRAVRRPAPLSAG